MSNNQQKRQFDLAERTAIFGQDVIQVLRLISQDAITKPLLSQTVRAATSIGANYAEADGAGSKKRNSNIEFLFAIEKSRKQNIGYACWPLQSAKIYKMICEPFGKKLTN